MTEMPEKNAQPQAQPSAQPSAKSSDPAVVQPSAVQPSVVQTMVTVVQAQWTQFRPTALQALQWLTQTLQQWSRQLETQEKMAKEQGTSTAQPIDLTPVQTLANTFWRKTQPLWQRILDLLRPRLPASFQPLSDRTLSGILAGTLLLILWFFSLIPAGQTTPKPIDRLDRPTEPQSSRSTTARSTTPQPIRETRRPARSRDYNTDYDSVPVAIPDRLTADRVTPVQPPVKSASFPKTESVPSPNEKTSGQSDPIAASPIAQPEILSPEAQKRSKLRQDLDVIAGSLVDNAIVGIRPQFSTHSLTITLNDRWYNTPALTQDKLANSLLVIAQGKGFKQLQLESADGTLLARSPVVGEGMVVLQRSI